MSLKQGLPEKPIYRDNVGFWFLTTEANFRVHSVTDDLIKYSYVVSQLDKQTMAEVKDIIDHPPVTCKYIKIKEELIRRFEVPETERMRKLFEEKLEDRTPSQFYRRLQSLAGAGVTVDKILRHLWLRRLPVHCQELVVSRFELRNSKLAEIADKIMEASQGPQNSTSHNTAVDNIQKCIDVLGKQVVELGVSVKRQSRSRSPSTGRSGSKSPSDAVELCWYHQVWGKSAHTCTKPCGWKKEEE